MKKITKLTKDKDNKDIIDKPKIHFIDPSTEG
jgi:hypothetical protein